MDLEDADAEVHNICFNGLDSEAVGGLGADSTIADNGGNSLPSTNVEETLYQSRVNSRAPSPVFQSPNASRLPSPVMDPPAQSNPIEPVHDPLVESLSSNRGDDLPQKAAPSPQAIEKPTSTSDPVNQRVPSAIVQHHSSRPDSTLSPPVHLSPLGGNPAKRVRQDSTTDDGVLERQGKRPRNADNTQQVDAPALSGTVASDNVAAASDTAPPLETVPSNVPATSNVPAPSDAASLSDIALPNAPAPLDTPTFSNAPAWFTNAVRMFNEPSLDLSWTELVELWSSFEQKESYTEAGKLSPKNRPAVVGQWIARARPGGWRPNIADLPGFERQFQQWWVTIQPVWRVSDRKLLKDVVNGDWDSLRRPGLNGIVSVLAALFYWGLAVKQKPGKKKVWMAAVEDCQIVFRHLLLA